jgi:hypothetical protein
MYESKRKTGQFGEVWEEFEIGMKQLYFISIKSGTKIYYEPHSLC